MMSNGFNTNCLPRVDYLRAPPATNRMFSDTDPCARRLACSYKWKLCIDPKTRVSPFLRGSLWCQETMTR
jgi:hypothetical protein